MLVAFLVGLALPLIFRSDFRSYRSLIVSGTGEVVDTTDMVIDGGLYSGSIIRNSKVRSGFGSFRTKAGSVYEGKWRDDRLIFGKRITPSSVYTGRFDSDLNNNGFGIIEYTDEFIQGKKRQGLADSEITVKYIGNWRRNTKQGLGRSIMKDGSMVFGNYSDGILQKVSGANYRIGSRVYGIDVSHKQDNIDWNNLALFCDNNGEVSFKHSRYMQPVFFVYIKATEGATLLDGTFNVRTIEAERHGIVKGAYHFLSFTSSVDAQLSFFMKNAPWHHGDLPPALDVEDDDKHHKLDKFVKKHGAKALQSMVLEWLTKAEKKIGVRPVIYTNEAIRKKYLNDSRFSKYQFWISRYRKKRPDNPDWKIWQKTDVARVNGYKKIIDIDLFNGDYVSFQRYINNLGK